jgi:glyoxylase-like metal-dependent hydrolase (beta-lactamase superfamily II)
MKVQHFFDSKTNTLSYVCYFAGRSEALIIDPVWDFDIHAGKFSAESYSQLKDFLKGKELTPTLILETHVHADHVSASQLVRRDWPDTPIMIGSRIREVQKHFKAHFGFGDWFKPDGSQFDILMEDGETRKVGPFTIKATGAPGHTPVDMIYQVEDAVFAGDVIFMPDSGTGRCDFPGGDARAMYHSVHDTLYGLPGDTVIYACHDYQPGGRELKFKCTVDEARRQNIHIKSETLKEDFVKFRTERDKTLSLPKLFIPSLQINMNAGHLPPPDANGIKYLKFPIAY